MKLCPTFSSLWPGYCLFWLYKRNATHKIPGTSTVYWVAWFVEVVCTGLWENFRKTKAEIVVFGIIFYIKDVYLNKFNIKNSKYVLGFTLLDILSIHWELKTENSWWSRIRELLSVEF